MTWERQSQTSILGSCQPHEVREVRHSIECSAPERDTYHVCVYVCTCVCVYTHTHRSPPTYMLYHAGFTGCHIMLLTNVKHDLKCYYTVEWKGGWFSILKISISSSCTYWNSPSPIWLNNLLLSLISVLRALNCKNHFHFICTRKSDAFLLNSSVINTVRVSASGVLWIALCEKEIGL